MQQRTQTKSHRQRRSSVYLVEYAFPFPYEIDSVSFDAVCCPREACFSPRVSVSLHHRSCRRCRDCTSCGSFCTMFSRTHGAELLDEERFVQLEPKKYCSGCVPFTTCTGKRAPHPPADRSMTDLEKCGGFPQASNESIMSFRDHISTRQHAFLL
jgi:hypothetical protein